MNLQENIVDKHMIEKALLFYGIDSKKYKNKCYECLDFINNSPKLLKEFNDLYDTLYIDKTNKINKLWDIKTLDKLINEKVHPYIPNLLLLSGYKIHKDNMKQYNLNDEQINIHKLRIKECLINDIILRKYDGIRISEMLWGVYFVNIKLIEVGRLQYEYENESSIYIHIPKEGKLDLAKVRESLKKSKCYIEKYFGLKEYNYYCDSWLLSKQVHGIVDKNSNIYKFYELFEVEDGENCIDDILDFVYGLIEIEDYNKLPEKTSLQRNIKKHILSGNDIKIGKGILK